MKNDGNEAIKFQKVHLTNLHDFYVINIRTYTYDDDDDDMIKKML